MQLLRKLMPLMAITILSATAAGCGSDSDDDSSNPEGQASSHITVKILHFNDTHSHLAANSAGLSFDGLDTGSEIGGMARIAAKINELKSGAENSLVLHAGDAVQGTLYYTLFRGKAEAEVMNAMGFDAMTIGNHEFDDGDQWLAGFINTLNFPVISANIEVPDDHLLAGLYERCIVKEVNGERIGIIGLTIAGKTRKSSRPGGEVTFDDELTAVWAAVEELTAMGVGKIILLSHYGHQYAQAIAAQLSQVDIIVDGDSHTLLGDFSAFGLESSGEYPTIGQNGDGDPVCVVQAWEYGKVLGELDATFDGDVLESCSGTPHLILGETFTREDDSGEEYILEGEELAAVQAAVDASDQVVIVGEDPTIAAIIGKYAGQLEFLGGQVIGTAGVDLLHNRVPGHEYNGVTLDLGSDIAPLVAKSFYEQYPPADLCIQNGGGVRISIYAGEITYAAAYELLPFANTLFALDMFGSEIKQVLEDAVENIVQGGSSGAFPYSYALRYDVDATQPYGSRVGGLEIMDRETGVFSPLQDDVGYVVVTNDFIASGRDGYTTFALVQEERGPGIDTYLDYAMSFANYVESLAAAGQPLLRLPVKEHCIKSYTPTPQDDDDL